MIWLPEPPAGTHRQIASALGPLPIPVHQVKTTSTPQVSGGVAPGVDTFRWMEYRKPKDGRNQPYQGRAVEIDGTAYAYGAEVSAMPDQSNVSCLRRGDSPLSPPISKIKVGHNVPEAVRLLSEGEVIESSTGLVELYDQGRHNLLAVYDPNSNIAGDTQGTNGMSPESVAVYLVYRALHPEDLKDQGFTTDLAALLKKEGSMMEAIDSATFLMKETNNGGHSVAFGGHISTRKCPHCGRFMGDAHVCPVKREKAPIETASRPVDLSDRVGVMTQQTRPSGFVTASQYQDDQNRIIEALRILDNNQSLLQQQITVLQQQISTLQQQATLAPTSEKPPQTPGKPKERKPYVRGREPREPRTEQEEIFSKIVLPAPDLYLTNVPEEWGGNREEPVFEFIPEANEDYVVTDEIRDIMQSTAAFLDAGLKPTGANRGWSRTFGLFGLPGTGKNELINQLTASIRARDEQDNIRQGLRVVEVTVEQNSMAEDFLGGTAMADGSTVVSFPGYARRLHAAR